METHTSPSNEKLSKIQRAIDHAAHYLPAQGPITAFVHHNTLHAFETGRFLNSVERGARVFGCQPYLSEDAFREKLAAGEFGPAEIEAALIEDLDEHDDELIGSLGTRFGLRFAMLLHPVHIAPNAELTWLIADTDALRKFRSETSGETRRNVIEVTRRWIIRHTANGGWLKDSKLPADVRRIAGRFEPSAPADWSPDTWEEFTLNLLWQVCEDGARKAGGKPAESVKLLRHRDFLYRATGCDVDLQVNEVLVRFTAAFLDQGYSQWTLPGREAGFYPAFLKLYSNGLMAPGEWLEGLSKEVRRLRDSGFTAIRSIAESLTMLGVEEDEWEEYLAATGLALRGWAGMVHQVEQRGDRVPMAIPSGSLVEFFAVRLLLDRIACQNLCRTILDQDAPLSSARERISGKLSRHVTGPDIGRAFTFFQIAQVRGWVPEALLHMPVASWRKLAHEVESFGSVERRKVFQLAFERAYRQQVLDAFVAHTRKFWLPVYMSGNRPVPARPSFQVICCIDDREESFRRYLEELEPACETFGAAGFFSVPMYYRGAMDANFVPLCPINLKPENHVIECVDEELLEEHEQKTRVRRTIGRQAHAWHVGSRTFLGGAATAFAGSLATIPMVARVLFPAWTARFRKAAGRWVSPPPKTRLVLERTKEAPDRTDEGIGFSVVEMADSVERLLTDIGLTTNFSRLIVVCGHGSASLNNPHESAYNCGACGGGRGGPNARAIAAMANDSRVRDLLAGRGLSLPADSVFIGAYHNTCDESVHFFDQFQLPESHHKDLERFVQVLDQARERNALERCRRFVSAPLSLSRGGALYHVEERSEDLSQTRPEYNHATNAVCTVGRRSRTRGLYLDRRSFLVSYDPRQDDGECRTLERILQAVVPVCAGINLEYYFSRVDPGGYGCGTKLPHNVTSLLGVMDGAASDLRTGLSAQMVEIHEPVRLLFVIETRPEQFLAIMSRVPVIGRLCGNGWVQAAVLSPDSDEIHLLRGDRFERYLPKNPQLEQVGHSHEWFRGMRGNVRPAHILQGLSPEATAR